jgi:alpha-methylacyl-CoA racemase
MSETTADRTADRTANRTADRPAAATNGHPRVLDGIKVLELARVAPAEMPGMLLADMGADVLKIETPGAEPDDPDSRRKAAFAYVNRNKRSLALNLKAPEGQAIFRKLAATADVLVEGFRPGVMKRLGADYPTLSALNPRMVYCSLSGFGQNGPYRDYPAHDGNYLSLGGVLNLIGEAGRMPVFPLNLVADYGAASMHGALGIMFALFARERTGRGQHVDVAYLDTTIALLAATPNMRYFFSDGLAPRRGEGFLGGSYPYYAVYETRDRKLLTIGCTEPWLWENFCKAIDRPDFVRFARKPDQLVRAANAEEIAAREEIQGIIRTRDRDDWYEYLVKADVCVGKVYEPEEMVADPQVQARDMVVDLEHPIYGKVRQFGVPIKLSETPGAARHPSPASGEDTDSVLRGLGMSDAEIRTLRDKKVVA